MMNLVFLPIKEKYTITENIAISLKYIKSNLTCINKNTNI
jgi:hypothetical protein